MYCISAVYYGSYQPHVAVEHLNVAKGTEILDFSLYLILILIATVTTATINYHIGHRSMK